MPRKPRNSPNPPGRPRKVREVAEVEALVDRTAVPVEQAAAKVKISPRTVRAHRAQRRAVAGAAKRPPASPTSSSPPTPASAPAGSQAPALPQGGAVSGRPDLLELLRRVGQARQARAWAEVEEGLRVHVAGGEEALAPWLVRPVEAVEVGVDELAALGRGLDMAVEIMQRSEHGGPALRALREVASLGKSLATVRAKRPHVPAPDEVDERVRGAMDGCVEWLLTPVREAAAKLVRDRAALAVWLAEAPRHPTEIVQRVDAMLGGPAS